jgi:hypothetical protein
MASGPILSFARSRGGKFHRCPPLRDDPKGYLAVVEQLLAEGRFDVLLGFLFARICESREHEREEFVEQMK